MDHNDSLSRADKLINDLDGLSFTDQVACLIGVMLSLVVATFPEGDTGKQVVERIIELMPRQYIEANAILTAQQAPGTRAN
jgi:hypothetical protein